MTDPLIEDLQAELVSETRWANHYFHQWVALRAAVARYLHTHSEEDKRKLLAALEADNPPKAGEQ
jgi:hypothetical protein